MVEGWALCYLLAEFVLDVTLDSSQHKGLEDHVKTSELVFVQLASFVFCSVLDVLGEPLIELVMRVKKAGHNEMQKSP